MNLNMTLFAGNLTRDLELRYTPKGTAVLEFSLAINRRWKTEQGEDREETTYIDCRCWARVAESMVQYLAKGRNVFVEGRMASEKWTDKQTNQPRSRLVCEVETWQFGSSPRTDSDREPQPHPRQQSVPPEQATGPRSQSAAALRRSPPPPPDDGGSATDGMGDDDIPF